MSHSPFFSPHLSHTLAFSGQDLARQRRLLDALHKNFISAVADGRGGRLRRKDAARLSYKTSAAASCWPSLLGPSKRTVRKMAEEVLFFCSFGGESNPGIWQKGGPTCGGKGAHSLHFFCHTQGVGLFDGSVYCGSTAVDLGLADGVGEMRTELQRRFGRWVRVIKMEPEEGVDVGRLLRWLL